MTVNIVVETLNRIKMSNKSKKLQTQFEFLAEMVTTNRLNFTAGKLFDMDYRAIVLLFNIAATYIIATVQFSQSFRSNRLTFHPPL